MISISFVLIKRFKLNSFLLNTKVNKSLILISNNNLGLHKLVKVEYLNKRLNTL